MERKDYKEYFVATTDIDGNLFFRSLSSNSKIHFAWGNAEKPRYIIQALVDLYWPVEWVDIYNKFLSWIAHVKEIAKDQYRGNTASFVLYK